MERIASSVAIAIGVVPWGVAAPASTRRVCCVFFFSFLRYTSPGVFTASVVAMVCGFSCPSNSDGFLRLSSRVGGYRWLSAVREPRLLLLFLFGDPPIEWIHFYGTSCLIPAPMVNVVHVF
jgi:hypothetical protein